MRVQKVKCEVCGFEGYSLSNHLKDAHSLSVGQYKVKYPNSSVASGEIEDTISSIVRQRVPRSSMVNLKSAVEEVVVPGTSLTLKVKGDTQNVPPLMKEFVPPFEIGEFVWAWENQHDTLVMGESGMGKSFTIKQMAAISKTGLYSLNGSGDISVADLYGYKEIVNGDTKFVEGVLPKSMESGTPLVIEEMDAIPSRISISLFNAMSDRCLYINEANKWYYAKPGWRIWGTANTYGRGDTTGRYSAREVLDSALIRRFCTRIKMSSMTKENQRVLIEKSYPVLSKSAVRIVDVCEKIRAAGDKGETYCSFGIGDMLNFTKHLVKFLPAKAFMLSFGNTLDTEEALSIKNIVEATLGRDLLVK